MQNKIALLLVIVLSIVFSACSLAESDTTLNQYGTSNTTPIYFTFASGDTVIMSANYTFGNHASTHQDGGSDMLTSLNLTDLRTGIIYGIGDYLRIGDATTTSYGLDSEDDLLVTGELEVYSPAYFRNHLRLRDDYQANFGVGYDTAILYETADGNAKALLIALPHTDEDINNVPVLVLGDRDIVNVDLGFFNGVTQPRLAIVSADRSDNLQIGLVDNDNSLIRSTKKLLLYPNADPSDYFTFDVLNDVPIIYGTGAYIRFGDAGLEGHLTPTEDDVLFTGDVEIDGTTYFDGHLNTTLTNLFIDNQAASAGLYITSSQDDASGVAIRNKHNSASPAVNDEIFVISFKAENNVSDEVTYGYKNIVLTDVTDNTENAKYNWYLIDDGTLNLAMQLSSNGTLSVDAGYGTFDKYDDVLLLRKGIQENDKQALIDIGIMHEVPVYETVVIGQEPIYKEVGRERIIKEETTEIRQKLNDNGELENYNHIIPAEIEYYSENITIGYRDITEQQFIGYNTMIDLQAFNRLIAGAIYQQDDYIKTLEARILALEERIK